jgi:hypothetical protein
MTVAVMEKLAQMESLAPRDSGRVVNVGTIVGHRTDLVGRTGATEEMEDAQTTTGVVIAMVVAGN